VAQSVAVALSPCGRCGFSGRHDVLVRGESGSIIVSIAPGPLHVRACGIAIAPRRGIPPPCQQRGVVADAMTGRDLARQPGDCLVKDDDVVRDRVRPGVAWTGHPREALTGLVREDEERVETPPTLCRSDRCRACRRCGSLRARRRRRARPGRSRSSRPIGTTLGADFGDLARRRVAAGNFIRLAEPTRAGIEHGLGFGRVVGAPRVLLARPQNAVMGVASSNGPR